MTDEFHGQEAAHDSEEEDSCPDSSAHSISSSGASVPASPEVQEPDLKKIILENVMHMRRDLSETKKTMENQSARLDQMEQTINGQYRVVHGINNKIGNLLQGQHIHQEEQRKIQEQLNEGHDQVLKIVEEVRDDIMSNLNDNATRALKINAAVGTSLRGISQTLKKVAGPEINPNPGRGQTGRKQVKCDLCGRQLLKTGLRQHQLRQVCIDSRPQ